MKKRREHREDLQNHHWMLNRIHGIYIILNPIQNKFDQVAIVINPRRGQH